MHGSLRLDEPSAHRHVRLHAPRGASRFKKIACQYRSILRYAGHIAAVGRFVEPSVCVCLTLTFRSHLVSLILGMTVCLGIWFVGCVRDNWDEWWISFDAWRCGHGLVLC